MEPRGPRGRWEIDPRIDIWDDVFWYFELCWPCGRMIVCSFRWHVNFYVEMMWMIVIGSCVWK